MHQQLLASSRLPPVSASVAVGQIPNAKRSFFYRQDDGISSASTWSPLQRLQETIATINHFVSFLFRLGSLERVAIELHFWANF
jgi:hypothetical protein